MPSGKVHCRRIAAQKLNIWEFRRRYFAASMNGTSISIATILFSSLANSRVYVPIPHPTSSTDSPTHEEISSTTQRLNAVAVSKFCSQKSCTFLSVETSVRSVETSVLSVETSVLSVETSVRPDDFDSIRMFSRIFMGPTLALALAFPVNYLLGYFKSRLYYRLLNKEALVVICLVELLCNEPIHHTVNPTIA